MDFFRKDTFRGLVLGIVTGITTIIPGISGAQVAVILKLYDKLMSALSNICNKKSFMFILPILLGSIAGIFIGFFTVQQFLKLSVFVMVSFFAGMMLAGTKSVLDEIKNTKRQRKEYLLIFLGILIPVLISTISIFTKVDLSNMFKTLPISFYFISFIIGILIALTQLIPGLSATALLLSLGLYNELIASISIEYWKLNPMIFLVYILLISGTIIGIIFIAKFIHLLINKNKKSFYHVVLGLCIGSVISMFYNPEIVKFYQGFKGENVLDVALGIILFIVGFIFIMLIYYKTSDEMIE